ncbi:MAG: DUF3488 and transglutaminase-like domain-containing protein [Actinomycetes bacterium]
MTPRRAVSQQVRPTLAAAGAVTLTALALSPTLSDGPWVLSSLLVIAATALLGGGARALTLPGWLVITIQAVGLIVVLTWLFARDVAGGGFLPGADVWRTFGELINQGSVVIEQEVAPVSVTPPVGFLVVGGIALIAWAVDAIAVTSRQATLAGVPLLALYLVPATVLPDGVPWPLFMAAGVGWLILLLEDGRLQMSRWGRPIEGGSDTAAPSVGGTGRRLGAAALTVAVIVPVILPSLDDGRFGGGSGGDGQDGNGSGSSAGESSIVKINPITDLQRDLTRAEDTEVLFYTTDAVTPEYLRIATLDQFDGDTWTLEDMRAPDDQQAAAGLPIPPGLAEGVSRSEVTYDVTVGALDTPRLPLPYPVTSVAIDGDWRWDEQTFDIFSPVENGTAFNQSYRANALAIEPTVTQLRAAPKPNSSLNGLLQLPVDIDDRLTPLAAAVTEGATTDYDRALALQNWFLTEFDYSLDTVDGNGTDALEAFLEDRSGYCEQFSATMALMARTLDIPSRVQVGFTPGERVDSDEAADAQTWLVTVHDAHSWPELWFEGVGWVRFEPTPGGGDGGAAPAYAPPPVAPDNGQSGNGKGNGGREGDIVLRRGGSDINNRSGSPSDLRDLLEANRGRGEFGASTLPENRNDESSAIWLWLLLLSAAGAVAAAPKVAQVAAHRRRWAGVASPSGAFAAAWADVLDAAADVDLRAAPTETPRDLATRLPARARLTSGAAADLRQLARWVELSVYRDCLDASGAAASIPGIKNMADTIRVDLLQGLSSRDRRLATWWPASGRVSLADAWNAASEWASDSWARLIRRTRRRPASTH